MWRILWCKTSFFSNFYAHTMCMMCIMLLQWNSFYRAIARYCCRSSIRPSVCPSAADRGSQNIWDSRKTVGTLTNKANTEH